MGTSSLEASKARNPLNGPIRTTALLVFAIAAGSLLDAEVRAEGLQAGLWKVVTKPVVNGATGANQEATRCLSDKDVDNLEATFSPNSRTINSDCETTERESTPQRLKWRLQCKGQIDMDVTGEFLFDSPKHYTATVTTHAAMMGQQIQNSRASIEGQYLGACQ
jgi:hypothetical protein